jgi:protein required for attachment to host cells
MFGGGFFGWRAVCTSPSQEDTIMETTWYLVGDASRAFLFQRTKHNQPPTLVKEFSHDASRAHESELVSDRQGRNQNSSGGGYSVALSEKTSPKEVEAGSFAKELSHYLSSAHNKQEYNKLILVAPPHFLGLLRGEFNQNVTKSVTASADKDLSNLPMPEMIRRLEDLA